jgi:hypothetical protein
MSGGWLDAYLPDGGSAQYEQAMRREEAYDAALVAKGADLWDSCLDPLVANDLANHGEVGFDALGSLLCLAAYAKTQAGRADREFICDRLVELFSHDIERIARYEVSKEF